MKVTQVFLIQKFNQRNNKKILKKLIILMRIYNKKKIYFINNNLFKIQNFLNNFLLLGQKRKI